MSGAPENLDLDAWYDKALYDAERSGLRLNRREDDSNENRAALEIENAGYAVTADAVHKALGIAEVHLPRTVESVEILLREEGHLAPTLIYQRQQRSIAKEICSGSIARVRDLIQRKLSKLRETRD